MVNRDQSVGILIITIQNFLVFYCYIYFKLFTWYLEVDQRTCNWAVVRYVIGNEVAIQTVDTLYFVELCRTLNLKYLLFTNFINLFNV